jgi:ADP-ribosyl-[dinitrogen reductase] hydrolase
MSEPLPAFCLERLWGAALGAMCGDALGAPVEGMSPADLEAQHGLVTEMLPGRLPAGSYTDDSQMMTGILETLAAIRADLDPALGPGVCPASSPGAAMESASQG